MASNNCPFCNLESTRSIIIESEYFYSVKDLYPVSVGHTLIISKRHTDNYFELSLSEKIDLIDMIDKVCSTLQTEQKIDGFNIGMNVNEAAGQTIFHTHIHVIPRILGDIPNSRGGVRNIIPNSNY
jgi:diadenosine tetraphosphate (Ap4A) HIT family hydrolase